MCPPLAPSARVFSERSAGDGFECGVNEILCGRVERVVVEEIEQLRDSEETLLARQHARLREAARGALADLGRGIVGQDREKRVDGFLGTQHGQTLDGPKACLLIALVRVAKQSGQYDDRLDAAIAESAQSP